MSIYNFTAHLGNKHYKVKFDVIPDREGEILGRYGLLPYKGLVAVYVFLKDAGKDSMHAGSYCSTKDKFDELKGCREALGEVLHRYHFTDREKEVFWNAFAKRIPIANQEFIDAIDDLGEGYQNIADSWRQAGTTIGESLAKFVKAMQLPAPIEMAKETGASE